MAKITLRRAADKRMLKPRFEKFCFLVALLCFCLAVAPKSMAELESVRLVSRLDPNAIIITEVDIIFIYDQQTKDRLPTTKSAWYSAKRAFTRNADNSLDIVNIFIPQGFDSVQASIPERAGEALQVLVIAYHDDAKAEPVDITAFHQVLVEIDPFGIIVSSQE
jgi:hypothetical protein